MKRSRSPKRKTPLKVTKGLQPGAPPKATKGLRTDAPLKTTKSLDRSSNLARTEINRRSDKRQKLMNEDRIPLIQQLIAAGFGCEIGPVLAHHGEPDARHCRGAIQGMHELRKRSAGGSLINRNNLVPTCNYCNGWVEEHPDAAHEYGLVVRQDDLDYERLGARQDHAQDDLPGDAAG